MPRRNSAYDFSPTLRASYTLGVWHNDAVRTSESYLRDAAGNPVYSGTINVDGRSYLVTPTDFAPSRGELTHLMHGLSIRSHGHEHWDWEIAASAYDYADDITRAPTSRCRPRNSGGAGRITDQDGTGWRALALRGTWRPGADGAHVIDFGVQLDDYRLQTLVSNTPDWIGGAADEPLLGISRQDASCSACMRRTAGISPTTGAPRSACAWSAGRPRTARSPTRRAR